MQAIRPSNLTDEEVLRQVYLMGNEMLPKEWVEELCTRLARAIDNPDCDCDCDDKYHEGFEDGFQAGVDHVNDDK
jgi:hypothetical protein